MIISRLILITTFSFKPFLINYTISIPDDSFLVKSFLHKKNPEQSISHHSGLSYMLYVKLSLLYPTPSPTVEPSWSGTHCAVRKGGLLRQLMSDQQVSINTCLMSVFNLFTNYSYNIHWFVLNVKCFLHKKNSDRNLSLSCIVVGGRTPLVGLFICNFRGLVRFPTWVANSGNMRTISQLPL